MKYFDTFAGVGGFHLALEQSIGKENIECIGYSEIDKYAMQVYEKHFPGSKDLGSITEIDIDNLEDFDLLTGGFPCQDVSVAGKQNLEGGRTVLVEYLLQILEKKQPKYFVFENVKGLMSKKFDKFRDSIFYRINSAGYNFEYKILNTKDFGLPQNRERVFIVGKKMDGKLFDYKFPKGQELTIFLKDVLEEEVDEKYFMTPKQYNGLSYDSIKRIYDKLAPTLDTMQGGHRQPKILQKVGDRDKNYWSVKDISNTIPANPVSDRGQKVMLPILPTQIGNSKQFGNSVRNNGIQYTLKGNTGHGIIYPDYKVRKLTPTECGRLQGFPDNWSTDFVSNSQAYKQMGNAISVPVVKNIFDNLF